MALLRELASRDAALPVIMITGHGDITLAVQAMKQGAYDFIEKPFSPERLVATCRRAGEASPGARGGRPARPAGGAGIAARLIGHSPAIERLRQMIAGLGNTTATC
jgi:two-component system C4-dicarboxylate transport response regulator DctD